MEHLNSVTIEEIYDPHELSDDTAQQVIELVLDIFRGNPGFAKFLESAGGRYGAPDKFRQHYMEEASGTVFTARKDTNESLNGVLCASLGKREVLPGMPEIVRFDLDNLLYVDWGSVKESDRGNGILGKLFEAFLERAKKVAAAQPDGRIHVFMNLHPDNSRNIIQPIFERRGFSPVGEVGEVRKGLLVMHRVVEHL